VTKARARPGHVAVVMGAVPIGLVTMLAALAAACAHVVVSDVDESKLAIAAGLGAVSTVNVRNTSLSDAVAAVTAGWSADVVYECSGDARAAAGVFAPLCPGGVVVFVGMPIAPIAYDVPAAQIKEARVEHVFRYAHVFEACVAMPGSGTIDLSPLITSSFEFKDSVAGFALAAQSPVGQVKMQIVIGGQG